MHAITFTAALSGFQAAQRAWADADLAGMPESAALPIADRLAAAEDAVTEKLIATRARTQAEIEEKVEALKCLIEDGGSYTDRRELRLMASIAEDARALGLMPARR